MKLLAVTILSCLLAGNVLAHSESFEPAFVQSLVASYLSVSSALAGDDLAHAKTGASMFVKAMANAPGDDDAKEEVTDLITPAQNIIEATDIEAARKAFLELSADMKSLIKHIGITGDEDLYVVHCPMAFGGKGGAWVQEGKAIANPYMGSRMLHCGTIREQIAGEDDEDPADMHMHGHDEGMGMNMHGDGGDDDSHSHQH